MKTCPECQCEFESGNFCPRCGKYVPEKTKAEKAAPQPQAEEPAAVEVNEEKHEARPAAEPVQPTVVAPPEREYAGPADRPEPVENGFDAKPSAPRKKARTPSTWSWVLTFMICCIPVVGLIYLICLAFGFTEYPSKSHFARALFIWLFIIAVIASIVWIVYSQYATYYFSVGIG